MLTEEEDSISKLRQLEDSVEAHPQDSSLRFDLGLFLWENGDKESKEKAAEHFLISAKLNPLNALPFKYLGHYYASLDSQRALKCYQRAVTLDPDDSQSGEPLCDILDHAGQESLEMAVCKQASEKSARAFWAFRRLGYIHLHHNRCSEAVQTLQHAIRGYPSCAQLWEALGLAYQRLGMFTAATKSYGRAIELEDTKVFSLVESGNIFLILGSFRKGVEQFRRAVEISPKNVAANYGLASGLLSLSKECMDLGAFRWGASLLEDAYKVADANTQFSGNFSCIWKLHGDIELAYAKCFPWMKETQRVEFGVEAFNASILSWKETCRLAAISAKRSYQRALHLAPWQANLYVDIAIASDLISSMEEGYEQDIIPWQLSEKMALGALLLEGHNYEFWVALGCLSGHNALKQHALIRGLQLDVSLAAAWAYLGKLYREEGEKKLARQAFDYARSVDPSLALPWAGMAADAHARDVMLDEDFESCLRAVQILPLAEFQIGLAKLAMLSGNLASSKVFVAIQQAVQRAPHCHESHNLNGLVCEARADFEAAIACYRLAHCITNIDAGDNTKESHFQDIAINLARSLWKAGYAADAVKECENLQGKGMLDVEGMQIYAVSLCQLGKTDLAIRVARNLAARVSTMERTSAAVCVSFICRLLYNISGIDTAITNILKMPKELFQSSRVRNILYAIYALDQSNRLDTIVSSSHYSLLSQEENCLIALAKLIKHGSECSLGFQCGINHLKKALHIYPNSNLMRNLLGYLLLSGEGWKDTHVASRCCILDNPHATIEESLKSGCEILGAGAVACYAIGNNEPRFSFPTCGYQCLNGPVAVLELQKYLHREPWNHNARYLLILNLFQRTREERFPRQLCIMLERLIFVALSNELYSRESTPYQYQKFQLLLCASEISLQGRNQIECIKHAKSASSLVLPNNFLFFGNLMLCRAYAAEGNYTNLQEGYSKCLALKTDYHIGWICLKILESQYDVQTDANMLEFSFKECFRERSDPWNMWTAVFNLVRGLMSLWNQEFFVAEESVAQACSLVGADSCLFLCHGATCMELARQFSSSQFLSIAARSLHKAQANSVIPLPFVYLLLAQAEGSLGSKEKWKQNLRLEWYSWPQEMRPAELFFQMHLLAKQLEAGFDSSSNIEFCQSPQQWVLRAIHTNPSCLRYWKILQKLME